MADEPTGTTDQPTGTTGQPADGSGDGGSGGSGVEETPEQLKARIVDLERQRQQDLSRLSTGEEAARRAEALEAENERLRQGSGYSPPTAGDPALARFQQSYQNLANRDPEAVEVITGIANAASEEITRLRREGAYSRELDSVPDDMKDDVRKRCKATPGLSPSWAQKDIESERWRTENAKLAERQRKLDEEDAARRKGRVDTSVTPIPGSELHNGDMTPAEYERLCGLAEQRTEAGRKALRRLQDYDEERVKMRNPG